MNLNIPMDQNEKRNAGEVKYHIILTDTVGKKQVIRHAIHSKRETRAFSSDWEQLL